MSTVSLEMLYAFSVYVNILFMRRYAANKLMKKNAVKLVYMPRSCLQKFFLLPSPLTHCVYSNVRALIFFLFSQAMDANYSLKFDEIWQKPSLYQPEKNTRRFLSPPTFAMTMKCATFFRGEKDVVGILTFDLIGLLPTNHTLLFILQWHTGPGCSNVGQRYPPDKSLSTGWRNWFP